MPMVVGRGRRRIRLRNLAEERRQLGQMGEYTPADLASDVNRVIAELRAKLTADQRNGDLSRALDVELDRAHKFQTTGLALGTLAPRVADLQRVRDETHLAYVSDPNAYAPADRRQRAADAAAAILQWYAAVTGQVLKSSNADAATVRNLVGALKDAPKNAIGWALDSLGLPKWLLPVGLVVVGVVALGQVSGGLANLTGALGLGRKGSHAR